MFARKEKTHDQHNSSGKEKLDRAFQGNVVIFVFVFVFLFTFVFNTFQDNVVHFELLVKSVDGVTNTLMLQPTAALSIARVTLMILSLKLDFYFEHNSKKAYIDIGHIQ